MLHSLRPSPPGPSHELIFHYLPSGGWLYRWDPRCKWLSFAVLSTAALKTGYVGLSALTLLVLSVFLSHRPIIRHFSMPTIWWLLLILIFLMNALNPSPGGGQYLTREGILKGLLVCWKILTLLSLAVILTATTSPSETVRTLNSFLSFMPLRWNHRLTTMITLTLRFVPYLMGEYRKIELAAYARTGRLSLSLMVRHLLPAFVRRSLTMAEDIALALQARGYREDLPIRKTPYRKGDIFALIALLVFAILIFATDRALSVKLL